MKKTQSNHVLLLGNYGAKNIGDEAILASLLVYAQKHYNSPKLSVLTDNHDYVQHHIVKDKGLCYPLFPTGLRSCITYLLPSLRQRKELRDAKVTLFGGGGLFTDNVSILAVLLWTVQFLYVRYFLGTPVIIMAQSIGPLKSPLARALTQWVMAQAKEVHLRDHLSVRLLQDAGIIANHIWDPAFFLPTPNKKSKSEDTLHIALSLRNWKETPMITPWLVSTLKSLSKNQAVHIHLIPMQHSTDQEGDVALLTTLSKTLQDLDLHTTLEMPTTYGEVQDILNICHIAIGMRLHFCILASTVHTPFLALSYSTKVSEIAKDLHMPTIDIKQASKEEIESSIHKLVEERNALAGKLEKELITLK